MLEFVTRLVHYLNPSRSQGQGLKVNTLWNGTLMVVLAVKKIHKIGTSRSNREGEKDKLKHMRMSPGSHQKYSMVHSLFFYITYFLLFVIHFITHTREHTHRHANTHTRTRTHTHTHAHIRGLMVIRLVYVKRFCRFYSFLTDREPFCAWLTPTVNVRSVFAGVCVHIL